MVRKRAPSDKVKLGSSSLYDMDVADDKSIHRSELGDPAHCYATAEPGIYLS